MCPRVFGEAMVGGHRSQIGDAGQAEQHHRPPLLDGDPPLGIGLFEVHHEVCARPRRPHRRDLRPGNQCSPGTSARCNTMSCSPCTPPPTRCQAPPGDQPWPPPEPRRRGSPETRPGRPDPPAPRGCDRRWPRHTRRWRLAGAGRGNGPRRDGATASSLITHAPSAAQSCTFRSWHGNEILRNEKLF